ncbi:hypothetical protein GGX14DRAFT_393010 [Mycena pura]|uniref:Uncharacterized protein n=1 Tax=Mycena pura TaxID=153505 RepID=A0AAD6YIX9_9AGAR|nr:hypothetical protein GGX14DRAFT_393010 [Mycena pura]
MHLLHISLRSQLYYVMLFVLYLLERSFLIQCYSLLCSLLSESRVTHSTSPALTSSLCPNIYQKSLHLEGPSADLIDVGRRRPRLAEGPRPSRPTGSWPMSVGVGRWPRLSRPVALQPNFAHMSGKCRGGPTGYDNDNNKSQSIGTKSTAQAGLKDWPRLAEGLAQGVGRGRP